jgi:hypothetical protein
VTKNQTVTFTLTGTGFQNGFTAKLINELGTQYDPISTQFTSSTTVKVTVFLGPGPTSTQKIRIINPGGLWAEISFTATASSEDDIIPPDTEITSGPSGTITTNRVTFSYTGTDNVTPAASLVYAMYLQGYDS